MCTAAATIKKSGEATFRIDVAIPRVDTEFRHNWKRTEAISRGQIKFCKHFRSAGVPEGRLDLQLISASISAKIAGYKPWRQNFWFGKLTLARLDSRSIIFC